MDILTYTFYWYSAHYNLFSIRQKNRDNLEKSAKVHETTIITQNMFSRRFFLAKNLVLYVYFNILKRNLHFHPNLDSSDFFTKPKKLYRQIFDKNVNKT
jgi:hypothetical protein